MRNEALMSKSQFELFENRNFQIVMMSNGVKNRFFKTLKRMPWQCADAEWQMFLKTIGKFARDLTLWSLPDRERRRFNRNHSWPLLERGAWDRSGAASEGGGVSISL